MATVNVLEGDLIEQSDVDAIVNAWNRNLFPATRFTISGVSKAILRAAGPEPFRELRRHGILPVGAAVATSAGRLPHRAIIHVAGINHRHRASLESVRASVRSALNVAKERGFDSLAFPILGAGNGHLDPDRALAAMLAELHAATDGPTCRIMRYHRQTLSSRVVADLAVGGRVRRRVRLVKPLEDSGPGPSG